MSTRQISDWLDSKMGVKLSAPMVVKGLKSPQIHLKRLAEHVQPLAAYLSALSQHTVADLLFHYDTSGKTVFQVYKEQQEECSNRLLSPDAIAAIAAFSETWDQIPDEVKYMCRPYFDDSVVLGHMIQSGDSESGTMADES